MSSCLDMQTYQSWLEKGLFPFILRFLFVICARENGQIYDIDSCRDYICGLKR
jgi:hypothetical protein